MSFLRVDCRNCCRVGVDGLLFVFSPQSHPLFPFYNVVGVLSKEHIIDQERSSIHQLLKS